MTNPDVLKQLDTLCDLYKQRWGKDVDYTTLPKGITQEKFVDILERIDMMILDGTLSEGWQYFYDKDNDVVKLDIPTIFKKMEENKIAFNMSRAEFTKKLIKSHFIAGETAKEYYKTQRVATKYCEGGKKGVRRNVHLLKMSVCNKYEFFGLGGQLENIE